MPVSDKEMRSSPQEMARKGAATCRTASTTNAPSRSRGIASAPRASAMGTSTSAPSAVRATTTPAGPNSGSETLMNR